MSKPRQRGFTLIELIIFIVVVSAGLAGILSVINTVVKSSADPMVRKQTIAIAESLLEEILLKDFAKPGGSTVVNYGVSGWSRLQFDCVDNFSGYITPNSINTTSGIVDMTGASVAGLGSYNISPAVSVVVPGDGTAGATAYATANPAMYAIGAKRITVSVTGPQGTISLTGYRANDQ